VKIWLSQKIFSICRAINWPCNNLLSQSLKKLAGPFFGLAKNSEKTDFSPTLKKIRSTHLSLKIVLVEKI
jgi:hypothetical protein